MLEDFLDEERVAFGLAVDRLHQGQWRIRSAECREQFRDIALRHAAQRDTLGEALTGEAFERLREGPRDIEIDIAVGAEHQDPQARQVWRKKFEVQQR